MKKCEFMPFIEYINAGYAGMLTAHLNMPAVDDSGKPTSMSEKAINKLLVEEMGFEGLIFTDALTMEGAIVEGSRSVAALKAGNDVILMPMNPPTEIEAIKKAVETGEISQKSIDERCKKMLRYKYALGANEFKPVDIAILEQTAFCPYTELLNRKLTAASITVLKNENNILPLKELDKKNIAVVSLGDTKGVNSIFQERCEKYSKTQKLAYIKGSIPEILLNKLKPYNTVIVGIFNSDEAYVKMLESITNQCRNVIPVFFTSAYSATKFKKGIDNSQSTVIAWGTDELAQDYAAQTIYGGNAAKGVCSITITGVAKPGDGIHYEATRLGYTVPEEVGVSSDMLKKMDKLANKCLRTGAFPGCQIVVARKGKIIADLNYGIQDYESGIPVTSMFAFVTGTKKNFTVSRLVKFMAETATEMEIIKEVLYENGSFSDTHLAFLEQKGFATQYTRESAKSFAEYKRLQRVGEASRGTDQDYRGREEHGSGHRQASGAKCQ